MINKINNLANLSYKKFLMVLVVGFMLIFMIGNVSAGEWTSNFNEDLIACWNFDEEDMTGSGVIVDRTLVYNGTNVGADNTTGKFKTAYDYVRANTDTIDLGNFVNLTDNITVSWWGFVDDKTTNTYPVSKDPTFQFQIVTGSIHFLGGGISVSRVTGQGGWELYTGRYNGTHTMITINGTLTIITTAIPPPSPSSNKFTLGVRASGVGGTSYYDGRIDDLIVWNRSLSDAEVSSIWDSGTGTACAFNPTTAPTITLNSPVDNFETTVPTIVFNGTVIPFSPAQEIVSVSLFINGALNETNTSGIEGDYTFTKTLDFTNYNWTYESCDNESSCIKANNRTLEILNFIESNVTFTPQVFETDYQNFELNITTIPEILSISAFLNYNGTRYVSTINCPNVNCTISNNIDISLVTANEFENKSFFWEIIAFDGTTSASTNTTANQQNVSRIHLEECDATYTAQTLNFTVYDEQNLTRINPYLFDANFDQWLGRGSVKRQSNFSNSSLSEEALCILPNATYFIDATIEYDEAGNESIYTLRNYYFQNDTISNVSQDIFMYLLRSSASTSFILKVQDDSLLPVSDVLVEINRYYPGTNEFRVVQIAKMDENGKSIGFFETEIVDYKFLVTLNNETLLETELQKIIPEVSPFTLTFNIGDPLGAPWSSQEEIINLNSTLIWDSTTGIVTYIYIDNSSIFTLGRLLVVKESLVNVSANVVICNVTSTFASATLTCNVGSTGGFYIASALITRDSTSLLDKQITFQIETLSEVVGLLGLFFGWFLILIAAFMFKFNEIAGIWAITITVLLVNLTGLIKFGGVFVTAMIGIAIILTWIMEK